ncbi:ABC transporter [Streptomyces badius]
MRVAATSGPVKEYTLWGSSPPRTARSTRAAASCCSTPRPPAASLKTRASSGTRQQVGAAAGVSDRKLLDEIEPLLPKDATAQTGKALADQQAKDIESGLTSLNTMLLAFAGIALFVGIFLIANTFTMLIAQRTRELALMRAIGATRRQVKRSVLLEAAFVGALASVVGFLLGLGLATALRFAMGLLGGKIPAGPLIVSPTAVVSAFAVGILITVLAAWLPARRAAKIAPVAAMSGVHATASVKSLVVRNSIGGVITLLGSAGIVGGAATAAPPAGGWSPRARSSP